MVNTVWSLQPNPARQSPPTSHIPLPVILPPGQLKLGCDSEHLSHSKGISQLAAPVDRTKLSSPEKFSESNVISHHYIYTTIKKKKLSMLQMEKIVSHKTKLEKEKTN